MSEKADLAREFDMQGAPFDEPIIVEAPPPVTTITLADIKAASAQMERDTGYPAARVYTPAGAFHGPELNIPASQCRHTPDCYCNACIERHRQAGEPIPNVTISSGVCLWPGKPTCQMTDQELADAIVEQARAGTVLRPSPPPGGWFTTPDNVYSAADGTVPARLEGSQTANWGNESTPLEDLQAMQKKMLADTGYIPLTDAEAAEWKAALHPPAMLVHYPDPITPAELLAEARMEIRRAVCEGDGEPGFNRLLDACMYLHDYLQRDLEERQSRKARDEAILRDYLAMTPEQRARQA